MPTITIDNILTILISICYIALVTFLPSVQFMPDKIIWFQDKQRLLELLLLCLILIEASTHILYQKKSAVSHKRSMIAFFILMALSVTSTLLAISPRHALIELSVFSALCFLSLFIARLYIQYRSEFIKYLCYALWASVLLYLTSFYVGYITATIFKTPLKWPFPFTGFTNIRSFNQYQLWPLAFITLPLLAFDLKKNIKCWLYFALSCWWVLLFYSASRGVLIAWLIGMTITALIYQRLAWPLLRAQLFNISTGFIGYLLLFKWIPSLRESTLITSTVIRETTQDRITLWIECVNHIKNHPWLGLGPMNLPWYQSTMRHPHNSILQLASEWGLPATTIILAIVGYGMFHWLKKFSALHLKNQSSLDTNLTIILLFTVITNAAYSLVDGVIVMPISQILMFTMIGLMIGHYSYHQTSHTNPNTNSSPIKFRPTFAIVILVALIWSTLPEVKQGLSGYEKGFSVEADYTNPRIWSHFNSN